MSSGCLKAGLTCVQCTRRDVFKMKKRPCAQENESETLIIIFQCANLCLAETIVKSSVCV